MNHFWTNGKCTTCDLIRLELNNVFDKPEYADKRTELMSLLKETQKQYKDDDPDEKVNELFKGDRRLMKNR